MIAKVDKHLSTVKLSCKNLEKDNPSVVELRTVGEVLRVLKSTDSWHRLTNDEYEMYAPYKDSSPLIKVLRQIWKSHKEKDQKLQKKIEVVIEVDLKASFVTPEAGTSALIRTDKKGELFIAKRAGKTHKTAWNKVCISDQLREEFFADCKKGAKFHKSNQYIIAEATDPELYKKWSEIMNREFITQYQTVQKAGAPC